MRTPHVGLLHVLGAMDAARGERYIGRGCARPRVPRSKNARSKPRTAFVLFSTALGRTRTMIGPHQLAHQSQSPVAQRIMPDGTDMPMSSGCAVVVYRCSLLVSVSIRSIWPLHWCLTAPPHCTRTLPIIPGGQPPACALKRNKACSWLGFGLLDDIA